MLINLPDAFKDFIKYFSISDKAACNFSLNNDTFGNYFFHTIKAHTIIYCKRISQDEYLVRIPIKNNLEDITTNIIIK